MSLNGLRSLRATYSLVESNVMRLPSFLLPPDVQTDWFDLWLERFVQQTFPTLTLRLHERGVARRYELRSGTKTVVELAVLPKRNKRLEVRVARLHAAEPYDLVTGCGYRPEDWNNLSEPWHWREADRHFCTYFYHQVAEDFDIDLSSPCPDYPDGIINFVFKACAWQTQWERELVHFPDGMYHKEAFLFELREDVHLGIDLEGMEFQEQDLAPNPAAPVNGRSTSLISGAAAAQTLQTKSATASPEKKKRGRPGLSSGEYIYRLAKAQESVELKKKHSSMTWPEICSKIGWCQQRDASRIKLLAEARKKLEQVDDMTLAAVRSFREKEKKEMR
jgi:hypothetical protein